MARDNGMILWQPKELTAKVEGYSPHIQELLPREMQANTDRFIKRAMLELTTCKQAATLRCCDPASIVTAVIKSAELGIPIDGKLGYFIPYAGKATFMPSYLGLLAVARRSEQVKDAFVGMVHKNDEFKHGRSGAACRFEHTWEFGESRGAAIGAYCLVTFPDGSWTYELMEISELDEIRTRSKASNNGPWVTDTEQMYLKTVLRRALKRYCSDAGFVAAVQYDESEFVSRPSKRIERSSLNDALATDPPAAKQPAVKEQEPEVEGDILDQNVQDVLDGLAAAVEAGNLEMVERTYDRECGPESKLTDEQRLLVSAAVAKARKQLGGRNASKQQKELAG